VLLLWFLISNFNSISDSNLRTAFSRAENDPSMAGGCTNGMGPSKSSSLQYNLLDGNALANAPVYTTSPELFSFLQERS